ncbi:MAG TPA: alpha-ketoacid dehydrogenase subunit beta [Vicinamibacteria bacterium]|nr:alpha-ketoacid dehydrogenase subunit beta [Vicinamibacteria bacterium]
MSDVTYLEAIRRAMWEEMERDPNVILLGEDIGLYGGAFKVTEGFLEKFGEGRVIDTPISEEGFTGIAVGAAFKGVRPIVEFQFIDFIASAFNMITNFAAKSRYRWGVAVPIVMRGPAGGGVRAGPFHSQNPEMHFVHTPGIKVVAPATVADARGLMKAAIRDDDPVLYLEHKKLYRHLKVAESELEAEGDVTPLGKAAVRRSGRDVVCVTYGAMVHTALAAAEQIADDGIEVEVIDLRSLVPLDKECVLEAVRRTSKVMVLHEDTRTGGMGAELSAIIAEEAFDDLDGPIVRVTAPDTPVPYAGALEDAFIPGVEDVVRAARELAAY